MRIRLSDHFNYNKLLRFVAPSVVMMVFISLYNVVDGFFVSNYVGKIPFASITMIMPVLMVLGAVGLMVGTGGTAIIGKTLGEHDPKRANRYFSMLVYVLVLAGIVISIITFWTMRPIATALGARGEMLEDCVLYGRILIIALPCEMLQMAFGSFFVVAEKPKLGLLVTVMAGGANMVLDALFIAVFRWGLPGAAWATAISQAIGAGVAVIYFARKNDSLLRLTAKTKLYGRVLLNACINGSSEMVSNMAASVVTMLYNYQLLRFVGENGVAAYGVILYVSFIFSAIFYGYTMGSAPVISYVYGAKNRAELKNLFRKSMAVMFLTGIVMVIFVILSADALAKVFVGYDDNLYNLTVQAFHIFAVIFLFEGVSIFSSGFFTALNNGKISALIAFLRTFVFEVSAVLVMPLLWGVTGIWWAIVVAEISAFLVSVVFLKIKRRQYHYI